MTPDALVQAWPDGLSTAGELRLTLAPAAAADANLCDLIAIRLSLLAQTITAALDFVAPGFALQLTARPLQAQTLTVDYEMTAPATDAMAFLLGGLDKVSRDAGGDLFVQVDVQGQPAAILPHLTILPQVPNPVLCDAANVVLTPDQIAIMRGAEIFVAFPRSTTIDTDKMWDAMIHLSALAEEGCFDPAQVEQDQADFIAPIVGHDPDGQFHQIGLNFFPGAPALATVLVGYVSHVLRQIPPRGVTVTLQLAES